MPAAAMAENGRKKPQDCRVRSPLREGVFSTCADCRAGAAEGQSAARRNLNPVIPSRRRGTCCCRFMSASQAALQ